MSTEHNVAIIPHWVYETMKRHSLTIADCLDFNKVRGIFSAEDMACILATEDSFECLTGAKDISVAATIYNRWFNSASDENRDFLTNTVVTLAFATSLISMAKDRLYSPEAKQDHHEKPFIIYDLGRGVSGIVVYPGFFAPDFAPALYMDVVKGVLNALYVNSDSANIVSRSRWFRRYLELLAGSIQQ